MKRAFKTLSLKYTKQQQQFTAVSTHLTLSLLWTLTLWERDIGAWDVRCLLLGLSVDECVRGRCGCTVNVLFFIALHNNTPPVHHTTQHALHQLWLPLNSCWYISSAGHSQSWPISYTALTVSSLLMSATSPSVFTAPTQGGATRLSEPG